MPRFDGTGPEGRGPLTGRGFGDCNTDLAPQDNVRIFRRGRGLRFCNWRKYFIDRNRDIK